MALTDSEMATVRYLEKRKKRLGKLSPKLERKLQQLKDDQGEAEDNYNETRKSMKRVKRVKKLEDKEEDSEPWKSEKPKTWKEKVKGVFIKDKGEWEEEQQMKQYYQKKARRAKLKAEGEARIDAIKKQAKEKATGGGGVGGWLAGFAKNTSKEVGGVMQAARGFNQGRSGQQQAHRQSLDEVFGGGGSRGGGSLDDLDRAFGGGQRGYPKKRKKQRRQSLDDMMNNIQF